MKTTLTFHQAQIIMDNLDAVIFSDDFPKILDSLVENHPELFSIEKSSAFIDLISLKDKQKYSFKIRLSDTPIKKIKNFVDYTYKLKKACRLDLGAPTNSLDDLTIELSFDDYLSFCNSVSMYSKFIRTLEKNRISIQHLQ